MYRVNLYWPHQVKWYKCTHFSIIRGVVFWLTAAVTSFGLVWNGCCKDMTYTKLNFFFTKIPNCFDIKLQRLFNFSHKTTTIWHQTVLLRSGCKIIFSLSNKMWQNEAKRWTEAPLNLRRPHSDGKRLHRTSTSSSSVTWHLKQIHGRMWDFNHNKMVVEAGLRPTKRAWLTQGKRVNEFLGTVTFIHLLILHNNASMHTLIRNAGSHTHTLKRLWLTLNSLNKTSTFKLFF